MVILKEKTKNNRMAESLEWVQIPVSKFVNDEVPNMNLSLRKGRIKYRNSLGVEAIQAIESIRTASGKVIFNLKAPAFFIEVPIVSISTITILKDYADIVKGITVYLKDKSILEIS